MSFGSPWQAQLIQFRKKSEYICHILGSWGAEYFVLETIKTLKRLSDEKHELFLLWTHDEKDRLVTLLGKDAELNRLEQERFQLKLLISDKVAALLAFLDTRDPNKSKTLIFVEQRVAASILSTILSNHPSTSAHFQSAPFVGMSNASSRKYRLPELLDLKVQSQALEGFRSSGYNIIVATNALEEGIDVQACNVVVCFDLPQSVRSFIQRRGRARAGKSGFALFFEKGDSHARLEEWRELERQLKSAYQDPAREKGNDTAQIPDQEFCLPRQPGTDLRPAFSFVRVGKHDELVRGTVTLPNGIDASIRVTHGERDWETERAAAIDAAFQCYKALYEARLINENLLPVTHDIDLELPQFERLGAEVEVDPEFDPWIGVRESWSTTSMHYVVTTFRFCSASDEQQISMAVALPCQPPPLRNMRAFWDPDTTVDISFRDKCKRDMKVSSELDLMRRITYLISRSTHSDFSTEERLDFLVLFLPHLDPSALPTWLKDNSGRISLLDSPIGALHSLRSGFLRSSQHGGQPALFVGWSAAQADDGDAGTKVEAIPLLKRRNFAHPITLKAHSSNESSATDAKYRHTTLYAAVECMIDRLPAEIARLNLLLPLILQQLQDSWTVRLLLDTVLEGIPCKNTELYLAALTPPSLQMRCNYDALEFLGDSIFKLLISVKLYEQHQNWPEGFLTRKRALLVSNEYLASAAKAVGLPRFIRTRQNSWKKWWPIYMSDLDREPKSTRRVRTKLLADVVEALVGAAFLDGRFELSRLCISKLVPMIDLPSPEFEIRPPDNWQEPAVGEVEEVVGYKFRHPLLLIEALTHPSFEGDHLVQSYQRLEFLGDAVLDAIMACHLMQGNRKWSSGDMTRIKAAMANGNLLGFFCLNFAHSSQSKSVQQNSLNKFQVIEEVRLLHLWQLMRCHPLVMHERCDKASERLSKYGDTIRHEIQSSLVYPWTHLASLRPDKFFSDIIESLIRAIYVDSKGSLDECISFLERIGIMAYLRRLTDEDVDVVHPRTRLDWKTGSSTLDYEMKKSRKDGKFSCSIKLDDTVFVQVDGYESSDEAIVFAAKTALLKLQNTELR
ncbi:uncharacterized protein HMPREF1541_04254 [Cyphellophora europaea CBS 101466]|uniref:Dicer-like protein 2 n=1 Tax=Cyphellophora europaea (strain CBS 101466) TaxID=1220924 RepID=W2RWC1_CYPE1|nr:uncharacterized protein HMPREF1541_04254 [Cyphellophora europaea CBS 101466]ETN39979.1 hypothetical protein HMPREF1541_04254 [Cyphellophora europaea CBS 101466]